MAQTNEDGPRAPVAVVQDYLADLARGDAAAANDRFSDELVYVVPGRNRLAGVARGRDAASAWFTAMGQLSGGTYRMTAPVDWLASETHALLIAAEHATVADRSLDWVRAIVFALSDGVITEVRLFEDDQYRYDGWLGGTPASAPAAGFDEPVPAGGPEMSGDLDDARVRAIITYQRQVAAGDLEKARTIFWPDVTYTVPGGGPLAGTYRGPDEVMGYFAQLAALTDGTYAISAMHWLTSAERVGLLTRNHARRAGRSLSWDELIVFEFAGSRKKRISHFSGDQYAVDELLR